MFKKIYLEPENKTFAEVMSNGKSYRVPPFQRDYSWEEPQLEEFWQDVEQMLEAQIQHFMGYLVFQSDDNKRFEIIDGQQRLTTILLLILSALDVFKKMIEQGEDSERNDKRMVTYHQTYLGLLDTVTLQTSSKLELNRHNDPHFIDMLDQYGVPRKRGITRTNRKLNKTFDFFQKKMRAFKSGEEVAKLINNITDGLMFTTITVKDDLNAYLVFETLNARGMHLSAPDLLKNYFLSTLSTGSQMTENNFGTFERQWGDILGQLGATDFTNFLRSHIGTSDSLPYKKDLYRIVKKKINAFDKVMPYIYEIKKNAPVYAALQNHQDGFWLEYEGGQYTEAKPYLELLNTFNIKTPLSVLMVAYRNYSVKDFIKLLRWITVISVRYNIICNKSAGEQESIYNKLANKIFILPKISFDEVKQFLKSIYPSDKEFKNAFKQKTMPSRQSSKKIVFLLCRIEEKLSEGYQPPVSLTLEHVLPYRPNDDWQEAFGEENYNDAIDRLGNMAILSKSDNMAQESFIQKKAMLAKSPFVINQKIAEYDGWNIANLEDHQTWLADQAKSVWCIDGL